MEFEEIINNSEARLHKLKILSNFFDDGLIIGITVRTRVIHDIFASNTTLDTNKLELFHLQYTDSLIDLLTKLKKNLEQKYTIVINEIQINTDVIESFKGQIQKENFRECVQTHNLIIQGFLESLYNQLAFNNSDSKNILCQEIDELEKDKGLEYYRKLSAEDYQKLSNLSVNGYYEYQNFKIEKKLLGKINIQNFAFKFLCGFQFDNHFVEVYEFIHSEEHFIYLKEKKEFLSIKIDDFKKLDFSKNVSSKKEILLQLQQKNTELKVKSNTILKAIPNDIEQVLKDYNEKISAIEFLDDLQNIDEQTNILRTMLNINIK